MIVPAETGSGYTVLPSFVLTLELPVGRTTHDPNNLVGAIANAYQGGFLVKRATGRAHE
jgi:hypothetical protein